MSLFGEVAAALRDRGIPFAVIGAAALAVHGISRSLFAGAQDAWDVAQLVSTPGDPIIDKVEARLDALPARCRELWERIRGASSP